jgi:DNA invertase Pin-like site-specific DNA recombinase
MANILGYARVSSSDQNCSIQEDALRAAGATIVRSEKRSGTTLKGRAELETILDFLQAGDTLLVTRIDRLARSVADLERIVAAVKAKGAFLQATEQPIDTSSPAGTAFLQMLGVFGEFETALRRERQMEGIAKAKAEGRYRGRPATVDAAKVRELHADGVTPSAIAKRLAIGRASVYRALESKQAA